MSYAATVLTLSPMETDTLTRWARAGRSEHRQAVRARIILRARPLARGQTPLPRPWARKPRYADVLK